MNWLDFFNKKSFGDLWIRVFLKFPTTDYHRCLEVYSCKWTFFGQVRYFGTNLTSEIQWKLNGQVYIYPLFYAKLNKLLENNLQASTMPWPQISKLVHVIKFFTRWWWMNKNIGTFKNIQTTYFRPFGYIRFTIRKLRLWKRSSWSSNILSIIVPIPKTW